MNRSEIRTHIRVLADELTEYPEGLFLNSQLDTLINIAQNNVLIELGQRIPERFRTSSDITLTANKETYHLEDDLSITDLLAVLDIHKMTSSKLQPPIPEIDADDKWQFSEGVGSVDEPKVWGWEQKDTLFFTPIPDSTYPYKFYYFQALPALNHDTSDVSPNVATPHLPTLTHPLVATETLKMWSIRDEEEASDILGAHNKLLESVLEFLSTQFAAKITQKPGIKEYMNARDF